jgi:hypothetical protein
MREIEQDGFITDEIYIQETKPLERVDMDRAIPAKGCKYPKCEECRDYRNGYCTVPMVFTKQMYRMTIDTIDALSASIAEVREMVYDEILGKKTSAETGNYSVEGGILIDHTGYHKQVVRGREEWCPDGYHIETRNGIDYWVLDTETEQ